MKKLLIALLAIFAVAGVSNVEAMCCPREPKACPVRKKCVRESKCPKCKVVSKCARCPRVSKCGCAAVEAVVVDEPVVVDPIEPIILEDDSMDDDLLDSDLSTSDDLSDY